MKTINKLQFGISALQAGQKSATVNAEPTLIAASTPGKFTLSSPVTKALNIAVGENVMFHNNIPQVEAAIQNGDEAIVAYAEENGIDLNTREGQDAVLAAFTGWFISKGVKRYTKLGEPVMGNERTTKEEKAKYLAEHAMEIVEANREALVAQFGELSDEELAEKLTVDMVESPKFHVSSGSKTSTTSNATGVGCQLGFTDSAIWGALKADLGEEAPKMNRIFKVCLDEIASVKYSNGYEDIDILVAPIEFKEDVRPVVRATKSAE